LNNEQQEVKTTMDRKLDRKQIIIPAIMAIGMVLLVVGSASAATVNVLGTVRWSDGTLFSNSSTPPFDYFVITNNNNGQSWNQTTTPYYVNTVPNSANYALAIDDTTNISTNDILQFNVSGTDATHGTETNTTASVQFDGTTYTYYVYVTLDASAVTEPDLTVSGITANSHHNAGYREYFANESNRIYATITNSGGAKANASVACFNVSVGGGNWYNDSVPVPELNPAQSETVNITDPTLRKHNEVANISATVDCTNNVTEGVAGELNNVGYQDITVLNHGLKGTFYSTGQNMTAWNTFTLNGSLVYSPGNSYYQSGSQSSPPGWSTYTAEWTAKEPGVPAAATVKEARLYVMYTWDKNDVMSNLVSTTFDGDNIDALLEQHYKDEKGVPTSYPYGMHVYNMTSKYTPGTAHTAELTNSDVGGGNVSIRGMMLAVIYENQFELLTQIVAIDGFDLLYGSTMSEPTTHGTTYDEATAWAEIGPISVSDPKYCAGLVTFAPGADGSLSTGEGELIFNGQVWNDEWRDNEVHQIGISDRCVTNELDTSSNNRVGFQSSGDWMEASNAFLMVTEGADASVETATKTGYVSFSVDKGDITGGVTAVDASSVSCISSPNSFPYGLFDIQITGLTPGDTVNVTITLPGNMSVGKYWKVNTTAGNCTMYEIPMGSNDGDNVITIQLQDGGVGDHDGAMDGNITDPGGPANPGVAVEIDPCPVTICSDPACRTTVNISLSNVVDYGSGTINLYFDENVVAVDSIGAGDSTGVTPNRISAGHWKMSASNSAGVSGNVVFATVTFKPTGLPSECTDLDLTVEKLYDRNFDDLPTVVSNCSSICIYESDAPFVTDPTASPAVILNDTAQMRPRVQTPDSTNTTNLSVHVTDTTWVDSVYIDLTPILGAGHAMEKMTGPDGQPSGDWWIETNASHASLTPYCLNVMATDEHGNWNNGSCIALTVKKRGDITGPGALPDNKVTIADYNEIAMYTVGLKPLPPEFVAGTVPADSWNGVDMADALYIAMYTVVPGYPAP